MKRMVYGTKLSENRITNSKGQLICLNVPIAKIGMQEYLGEEVGADEEIVELHRLEEDVYEEASLLSLEDMPIVISHPGVDVKVGENYKELSVGWAKNIRKASVGTDKVVMADLVFYDEEAIEKVTSKEWEEVSVGYDCDIVEKGGKLCQTNIRGNHLALVERGRAGIAKIGDTFTIATDDGDVEVKLGGEIIAPKPTIKMLFEKEENMKKYKITVGDKAYTIQAINENEAISKVKTFRDKLLQDDSSTYRSLSNEREDAVRRIEWLQERIADTKRYHKNYPERAKNPNEIATLKKFEKELAEKEERAGYLVYIVGLGAELSEYQNQKLDKEGIAYFKAEAQKDLSKIKPKFKSEYTKAFNAMVKEFRIEM